MAGKTKFISSGRFTINDDAYVITVKEKYIEEIDVEWVEKIIYRYTEDCITSRGTNATFSKEQFLNLDFAYPIIQEQREIIRSYKEIESIRNRIHALSKRIDNLENQIIYGVSLNQIEIEKIFDIKGGNFGLTEEFIYNNPPANLEDAVIVYSSSTNICTNMGRISKNSKIKNEVIKCFNGPAIIVARNGQAGKVMWISSGLFTINDHAYVLTVKPSYKKIIDLEWFSGISEKYTTKCVTSKDSNGTFSKDIFLKEKVDVIDYKLQKKIAKKKREIRELNFKLKRIINMLEKNKI